MSKKKNDNLIKAILIISVIIAIVAGLSLLSVLDSNNIFNYLEEYMVLEAVDGQRVVSYKLKPAFGFDDDEEAEGVIVFYYNESGLANPIQVNSVEFFDTGDSVFYQIPVIPNQTLCAKKYLSPLIDDGEEGTYELFDFVGWDEQDERYIHVEEDEVMRGPIRDGVYVTKDANKSIYYYVGRNGIYFNEDFSDSKNKEGLRYFEDNILIWGQFYDPDGSHRGYGWGDYETYEIYELCFNNNPLYPELENTSCWYNWRDLSVKTHETCILTSFPNELIDEEPIEPIPDEIPDEIEEPVINDTIDEEIPDENITFWSRITNFFKSIWQWFIGLFK